ncbi:MAG: hypothetical protein C0508_02530 [Cyanobacteria bacterium PR.023]|nr:hypothetical protein [Cyanobacteria bacterium PR.023]
METDYPAAHSMDTTWFAVDKDGFIAVMETQEEGALPLVCRNNDLELSDDFVEAVAKQEGLTVKVDQYYMVLPESIGLYSYLSDLEWSDELAPSAVTLNPDGGEAKGPDDDAQDDNYFEGAPPYKRQGIPEKPLHISKLAEPLRAGIKAVVFENVSFQETKWLQPALRVPCEMWMDGDYHCIDEQGNAVKVPEQFCPPKGFFGSPAARPTGPSDSSGSPDSSSSSKSPTEKPAPWWKKFFG